MQKMLKKPFRSEHNKPWPEKSNETSDFSGEIKNRNNRLLTPYGQLL